MTSKLHMNPWLNIWLEPRATIRAIVNYDPKYRFILLSMIGGLSIIFFLLSSIKSIPSWKISIVALVISPFVGVFVIDVFSLLLTWTGKWIGGKSNYDEIRAAVAWSSFSNVVFFMMVFILALLVIFGFFSMEPFDAGVIFTVQLVGWIVPIWGFAIFLRMLAEVQGFSAWKALLNFVILLVILVAAIRLAGWGGGLGLLTSISLNDRRKRRYCSG